MSVGVEVAIEGVRGRLAELYAAHAPGAQRLAFLLTGDGDLAEDLVQEAFVRVARRFGDLRGPDHFGAYLRRTVINLARGHFRHEKIRRAHLERARSEAHPGTIPASDLGERDALWRELQQLPHRQRAALVLRFYEDLSEQQTADALDCSPGAARALVARGMATLRGRMEGDGR